MKNMITPFYKQVCFVIACVLSSLSLSAQITITEARVTNEIGQRIREVIYETNTDIDATLQPLILASGPDQFWNFSNLNYVDSTVTFEELALVGPGDPYVNNPNLAGAELRWFQTLPPVDGGVQQDTVYRYLYGNLEQGDWTVNGVITIADIDFDGQVDTFLQWFDPPSLQVTFPVTEGSFWHDSTTFNQEFMGMPFQSAVELDSNWVVGWGELQTPAGTAQALRVNNKTVNRAFGNPLVDVGNSIDFVTLDGAVSASIVIEDGRAFHRIRTNVGMPTSNHQPPLLRFNLRPNFPNPMADQTTIQFELQRAARVELQLYDAQAKVVAEILAAERPAGVQNIHWQNPGLAAGIYYLRMRVGQQFIQQLLVIQ